MHAKFQLWQIHFVIMGQYKLINLKKTKLISKIIVILVGKANNGTESMISRYFITDTGKLKR